jgi:uncharacterized membrane protein required for colicin V production
MLIDVLCIGFCLLYGLFGWFSGGLIQVFKIGAMIAAYFGAIWIEPLLTEILVEQTGIESVLFSWGSLLVSWIVIYLILDVLLNLLIKTMRQASDGLTRADRILGMIIGLLKAGVMIVLLVLLFSLVKDRLYKLKPNLAEIIQSSMVMQLVANSRAADYILPDDLIHLTELAHQATEPEGKAALMKDPAFKGLSEVPEFQQLSADPKFRDAVNEGRMADIFSDPRVQRLLNDPKVREMLLKLGRFKTDSKEERSDVSH